MNTDALSRNPQALASGKSMHVAVDSIPFLLQKYSAPSDELSEIDFAQEQLKDQKICEMTTFF